MSVLDRPAHSKVPMGDHFVEVMDSRVDEALEDYWKDLGLRAA